MMQISQSTPQLGSLASALPLRTRALHRGGLPLAYAAALALAALVSAGGLASTTVHAQGAAAPAPAPAADAPRAVQISSVIMVERAPTAADGSVSAALVSPENVSVVPGDKLLFTLSYTNTSAQPAANFVAVNPVDPSVAFTGVSEDWADVSVDGGKSWGKLAALTVMDAPAAPGADAADTVADERSGNVTRPATQPLAARPARTEDVTHVRWKFPAAIPAGGKGELSFRGVVK